MDRPKSRRPTPPDSADSSPTAERRRIGRIVHDDRGMASVEWLDAPSDYERPVLELDDGATPTADVGREYRSTPSPVADRPASKGFNPYDSVSGGRTAPKSGKRDLRQLSEWIKLTREIQRRKQEGED